MWKGDSTQNLLKTWTINYLRIEREILEINTNRFGLKMAFSTIFLRNQDLIVECPKVNSQRRNFPNIAHWLSL